MTNPSENNSEANQPNSQEEKKPLFSGTDSQGKERLFTNVEDAQQSWQSAQNFIKDTVESKKSLEAQVQELKAQLNQSTKLEDALAQLRNKEEPVVTEPSQQQTTETTPQLDVQQLKAELLSQIQGDLSSASEAQKHSQNQQKAMDAAQAVYGESYEDKLRETAQSLGMSDEDIVKTAQTNPTLFNKVFGLDKQPKSTPTGFSSFSGRQAKPETKLNLGTKGFSTSQVLDNHMSNLEALMKKHSN